MKAVKRGYGINALLTQKRLEKQMTQREAAEFLKLDSPQYVSNIERCLCRPSLQTINALADLYEINRREIVDVLINDYKEEIEEVVLPKARKKNERS